MRQFQGCAACAGNRSIARQSIPWGNPICIVAWLTVLVTIAEAQLPPPPVPPENPITEPKRVLGKILFWEEQLSSDNTVSCGTCPQPFRAATDPRPAVHPGLDLSFGTPDDGFGDYDAELVHVEPCTLPRIS